MGEGLEECEEGEDIAEGEFPKLAEVGEVEVELGRLLDEVRGMGMGFMSL